MPQHRIALLQRLMADTATDVVVVGPTSHMRWLTGLSPHGDERPVMLFVTQHSAGLLIPDLNAESQRAATRLPFYTWADAEGPAVALSTLLQDIGAAGSAITIAIDEGMRADFALLALDAINFVERRYLHDTVGALRARKDAQEYAALKNVALLGDGAMRCAFAALRPGITELQVAAEVVDYFKSHGAAPESVSVCFGENGAFPHHLTGSRTLRCGDAVLLDLCGRFQGYPSDMTRIAVCGVPPDGFEEARAVVEAAFLAALAAAKPGVQAKSIDAAARNVISEAGYGPFYLHRTGHGVGIDIHERPYITGTSETIIEEGHTFSIEPGIYLKGRFGVRLEEVVIVRASGAEVLSELPRQVYRV